MIKFDHEEWMMIAIEEANKAKNKQEVPVGAIIISDDRILSKSHNLTICKNDPTAHAEINAIRIAAQEVKNHRIKNSTLYVTLEPCAMCYGAIIQARINKVIFGAFDKKSGVCLSCCELNNTNCFNHKPEIIGGVLEHDCSKILKEFFANKRS